MVNLKTLKRTSLLVVILLATISESNSQSVNYKVLDNTPHTHFLNLSLTGLDFMMVQGAPMSGPGLGVELRPLPRIMTEFNFSSALYDKAFESGANPSGMKKIGGAFSDLGATFIWSRKGINQTNEKGSTSPMGRKFSLKSETFGVFRKTTSILFPYNRMVERGLRGGAYYYDIPSSKSVSNSMGAYVGLSKWVVMTATLDVEGIGEKYHYIASGYHFDLLFGKTNYNTLVDGNMSEGGIGWRFEYKMLYGGGLFPLSIGLELGSFPGQGGMFRVKFSGNILTGKQKYNGDYKYVKKAKRFIPALIQAF